MKIPYFWRIVLACGGILSSLQACNREPDFPSPTTTSAAGVASTAAARRWYEVGVTTGAHLALDLAWDQGQVVRAGGEEHLLVPIHDTYDRFASSPYRAYRRLVVHQQPGQPIEGTIIELLVERAGQETNLTRHFDDLYQAQRRGQRHAPEGLAGAAFFYTAHYTYLTGYRYRQGRVDAHSTWLQMLAPAAGPQAIKRGLLRGGMAKANNEEQGPGPGFPGNPNPFPLGPVTVTPPVSPPIPPQPTIPSPGAPPIPLPPGGIPPGGGWGGCCGGSTTGTGPSSIPNMPTFMPKQTGPGGCVPASLTQVKLAICTNTQTEGQIEGSMFQYGMEQYGVNFINDGVPLEGMNSFVNHFFNTTILYPTGNFQGAINAGYPVMIDVFSHMEGPGTEVWHSVVVKAYDSSNPSQIYYLDPATGSTHIGDAATLFANSHYAIPITGCK